MTISRRGFMGAILAAGVAPGIIKIENAMRIVTPRRVIKEVFIEVPMSIHRGLDDLIRGTEIRAANEAVDALCGAWVWGQRTIYGGPIPNDTLVIDGVKMTRGDRLLYLPEGVKA